MNLLFLHVALRRYVFFCAYFTQKQYKPALRLTAVFAYGMRNKIVGGAAAVC